MTNVQEIYEKGQKELAAVPHYDRVNQTRAYVEKQEGAWSSNDVVKLIQDGANGLLLSALLDKAEGETIYIPNNGPLTIDDFLSHMSSPKRIECQAQLNGKSNGRYLQNIVAHFQDMAGELALSNCTDCTLLARKLSAADCAQQNANCKIDIVAYVGDSGLCYNKKSRINAGHVLGAKVVYKNKGSCLAIGKIVTQSGMAQNERCKIAVNDLEVNQEWATLPLSDNESSIIYAERANVCAVMRRNKNTVFMFDEFKNSMPRLMLQNSGGAVFLAYHATLESRGGFSECENFVARIKRLTVGKKRQAMINAARRMQSVGVIVESVFDGSEHVLNQNAQNGLVQHLRRPEYALLTSYTPDDWFFAQKYKEIVEKVSNVVLEPEPPRETQ